jgi:steroid delta-isomerase-like uncharacterized protein
MTTMQPDGARGLAALLVGSWNCQAPAAFAALYAVDAIRVEFALPGARLVGREEIADHVALYMRAISECHLRIRGAWDDGAHLVVEWTLIGRHVEDLPGLPARGEDIELAGVSVYDVADGLIREERVYWDAATVLAAAGALA